MTRAIDAWEAEVAAERVSFSHTAQRTYSSGADANVTGYFGPMLSYRPAYIPGVSNQIAAFIIIKTKNAITV